MSAKLKQLQDVRSRLADDIIAFCDAAITHLDATPYHCKVDGETVAVTISGTVVDARVYTEHRAMEVKPDAANKRRLQADEEPASQNDHERRHAELNGDPMNIAGREAIPWSRALQRAQRGRPLVVLGAPGRGKTTLTRHAAVQRLTAVRDGLGGHTLRPEDGEPMLWTTCTVLAGTPLRGNDPADLVVRAAFAALGLPENVPAASLRVQHWLRGRLADGRCAVALDSLDEVPERKRAAFRGRAHQLRHLTSPLILTCRSHDWEQREDVPWPHLVEVKLAPFTRREQSAFVRRFFREEIRPRASARSQNADLSRALERELSRNVSLRRMCASPILLFFTCLLHANEPWPQRMLRRTEIYESMCSRLFRGTWRGEAKPPPWADGDRREGEVTAWLAEVALALFRAAPEAKEFSLAAWKNAVLAADAPHGGKGNAERRAAKLFDELVECGLFIPVGKRDGQPHYVWPHRSFLAYFAGKVLSTRPKEVWLREAIHHLWFQTEWDDVLLFLAGHLSDTDADLLLREVETQSEDIFHQRVSLQWRLAAEMVSVSKTWGERWTRIAISLAYKREGYFTSESLRRSLFSHLKMVERVSAIPQEVFCVGLAPEVDVDETSRIALANVLGMIGDATALPALLVWLSPDRRVSDELRSAVATAVGVIGNNDAVPILRQWLNPLWDINLRWCVAEALANIGSKEALETLLNLLNEERDMHPYLEMQIPRALARTDEDWVLRALLAHFNSAIGSNGDIKTEVAMALAEVGFSTATPNILEWLDPIHNVNYGFRHWILHALATMKDVSAVPQLLSLANMADEIHERFLADILMALGRIGGATAIRGLHDWVKLGAGKSPVASTDTSWSLRATALWSLGQTGDPSGLPICLSFLDAEMESDLGVRQAAAQGLGSIRDAAAVPFLIRALDCDREPNNDVRMYAAFALGQIADRTAVKELLRHIEPELETYSPVRDQAVAALGKIGDPCAVEALCLRLNPFSEKSTRVREWTAKSLGQIGDVVAIGTLKRSLDPDYEADEDVRGAVAEALFNLFWRAKDRSVFLLEDI